MADQLPARPTSSFPDPKPNMNPFLPPQPRPASIATDVPYVAPPAYPHEQSYPQTGVKSEFDSDGIEFLKPIDGECDERSSFPTEKAAWNTTLQSHGRETPQASPSQSHPKVTGRNSMTISNRAIGFQPPGPPPARPTRPPSSQIWAPLPHNPAYHQGHVHANPYHEPDVSLIPYDQGANEAGFAGSNKPPIKTVAKVFKICFGVFLFMLLITAAFGAGYQAGRRIECGPAHDVSLGGVLSEPSIKMTRFGEDRDEDDDRAHDDLEDVLSGREPDVGRLLTG